MDAIKQVENGRGDPHFGNFLTIPGKDNGFDLEGLAVSAERIFYRTARAGIARLAGILDISVHTADSFRLNLKDIVS